MGRNNKVKFWHYTKELTWRASNLDGVLGGRYLEKWGSIDLPDLGDIGKVRIGQRQVMQRRNKQKYEEKQEEKKQEKQKVESRTSKK